MEWTPKMFQNKCVFKVFFFFYGVPASQLVCLGSYLWAERLRAWRSLICSFSISSFRISFPKPDWICTEEKKIICERRFKSAGTTQWRKRIELDKLKKRKLWFCLICGCFHVLRHVSALFQPPHKDVPELSASVFQSSGTFCLSTATFRNFPLLNIPISGITTLMFQKF